MHTQHNPESDTDTDKNLSDLHTPDADTHRHPTPKTFFPAKVADTNAAPGRIDATPGKVIHPEGCNSTRRTDPNPYQCMRGRNLESDISEVLGRSIYGVGDGRAVLFLFLWNFSLSYCSKLLYCKYYPGGGT